MQILSVKAVLADGPSAAVAGDAAGPEASGPADVAEALLAAEAVGDVTVMPPDYQWIIALFATSGSAWRSKDLVKDRLDITGARWGLSGAEAVLKLRALRSNGDFDTYWAWHEKQEFTRNHQARYRDTLIPAA
ncbi:hypothetical protein J7E91_22065 [Streptomyces sp. ISL-99]|nr:hypothetical protein [Streptomyces sp. ISL-99]